MSILQQASVEDRKRVLDLFPVANLKAFFSAKGSKEDICHAIASSNARPDIDRIAAFLDDNLNLCKQHVHVFSHLGDATLPQNILGGERILEVGDHALYLVRTRYEVILLDPTGQETLEFLWPIRIEITPEHLIVRFIVLEKNPSAYFARQTVVRGKSLDEDEIIAGIRSDGTLSIADLNKGVKALWEDDYFDATSTKYKKPGSIAWEAMDEERGIKQFNRSLYEELRNKPLYSTTFKGSEGRTNISAFSSNPTNGFIGFTRYCKEGGESDELIRQILKNN